jgi:ribosome-binding factor A
MNESNRQRKVAQIIQEDFAELLENSSSESKQNFLITVSDVKVTADLSIAKIYLSIFPQEFRTPIMKEIDENKSFLQKFYWAENGKTSANYHLNLISI